MRVKACVLESQCMCWPDSGSILDPRNPFLTILALYPQCKIVFVVCDPDLGVDSPIYSAVAAATAFLAALPAARRALLAAFSSSVMAA